MADCIFFFQEFADKGVSPALSCLSLKVYDADGVALLYPTFYTFNALKEMRTFNNFAVKNGSVLVSCFVGKYSKMLGEWKVSNVVLFQNLLCRVPIRGIPVMIWKVHFMTIQMPPGMLLGI